MPLHIYETPSANRLIRKVVFLNSLEKDSCAVLKFRASFHRQANRWISDRFVGAAFCEKAVSGASVQGNRITIYFKEGADPKDTLDNIITNFHTVNLIGPTEREEMGIELRLSA